MQLTQRGHLDTQRTCASSAQSSPGVLLKCLACVSSDIHVAKHRKTVENDEKTMKNDCFHGENLGCFTIEDVISAGPPQDVLRSDVVTARLLLKVSNFQKTS